MSGLFKMKTESVAGLKRTGSVQTDRTSKPDSHQLSGMMTVIYNSISTLGITNMTSVLTTRANSVLFTCMRLADTMKLQTRWPPSQMFAVEFIRKACFSCAWNWKKNRLYLSAYDIPVSPPFSPENVDSAVDASLGGRGLHFLSAYTTKPNKDFICS